MPVVALLAADLGVLVLGVELLDGVVALVAVGGLEAGPALAGAAAAAPGDQQGCGERGDDRGDVPDHGVPSLGCRVRDGRSCGRRGSGGARDGSLIASWPPGGLRAAMCRLSPAVTFCSPPRPRASRGVDLYYTRPPQRASGRRTRMAQVKKGDRVKLHYALKLKDGNVFETNFGSGAAGDHRREGQGDQGARERPGRHEPRPDEDRGRQAGRRLRRRRTRGSSGRCRRPSCRPGPRPRSGPRSASRAPTARASRGGSRRSRASSDRRRQPPARRAQPDLRDQAGEHRGEDRHPRRLARRPGRPRAGGRALQRRGGLAGRPRRRRRRALHLRGLG